MNQVVSFYLPISKANDPTTPIEVGDTVKVLLYSETGSAVYKDLTVEWVSDDARSLSFNADAENIGPSDIKAVHSQHNSGCGDS